MLARLGEDTTNTALPVAVQMSTEQVASNERWAKLGGYFATPYLVINSLLPKNEKGETALSSLVGKAGFGAGVIVLAFSGMVWLGLGYWAYTSFKKGGK